MDDHIFNTEEILPLRIRKIVEELIEGKLIVRYTLTPSVYQARLAREGRPDFLAVSPQEFEFGATRRIAGLGVGDYVTWNLFPYTTIIPPPPTIPTLPGTGLSGLLKTIFGEDFDPSTYFHEDKPTPEPDEPSDEEAAHTQNYILNNYTTDEWMRMNAAQRDSAIVRARASFTPESAEPTPRPGQVFAKGYDEDAWEKIYEDPYEGQHASEELLNQVIDFSEAQMRASRDKHPSTGEAGDN